MGGTTALVDFTYEPVRAPQGKVLMASKHARFGVERIDAEQLPGWVDDASYERLFSGAEFRAGWSAEG